MLAKNAMVEEFDLSSLRIITSGAAPLTKELILGVRERIGTEVKQAYGLSETSPVTHIQVCCPPPPPRSFKHLDNGLGLMKKEMGTELTWDRKNGM